MNDLTGRRNGSYNSNGPDPLDRMRNELDEMKEARKLLEYSADYEEKTGNVHVTVEASKNSSVPSKIAVSFVQAVRGWPQAVVGLGILVLIGWYAYLKLHH